MYIYILTVLLVAVLSGQPAPANCYDCVFDGFPPRVQTDVETIVENGMDSGATVLVTLASDRETITATRISVFEGTPYFYSIYFRRDGSSDGPSPDSTTEMVITTMFEEAQFVFMPPEY